MSSLDCVDDNLDRLPKLSGPQKPKWSPGLLPELSLPKLLEYRELEYRLMRLGVGEEESGIAVVPGTGIGCVPIPGRAAGGEGELPNCIAVRPDIGGCVFVGEGMERLVYESWDTDGPGMPVPLGDLGVIPMA